MDALTELKIYLGHVIDGLKDEESEHLKGYVSALSDVVVKIDKMKEEAR